MEITDRDFYRDFQEETGRGSVMLGHIYNVGKESQGVIILEEKIKILKIYIGERVVKWYL
jgi:hypothetical protein